MAQFPPYTSLSAVSAPSFQGELAAGLGWDQTNFPITNLAVTPNLVTKRVAGSTNFNAETYLAPVRAMQQYYVAPTGSDSNAGTSSGAAVRSLGKATLLANANGVGAYVHVLGSSNPFDYARVNGFGGANGSTGGGALPTVPMIWSAYGGLPVITGPYDSLAWTADLVAVNSYAATRSTCAQIFSLLWRDQYGNPLPFTYVSSLAICKVSPGTCFQNGSSIQVTSFFGEVISDTTCCVTINAQNAKAGSSTPATFWMEPEDNASSWELWGGNTGCFSALFSALPTNPILVGGDRIRARFSGTSAGGVDAFSLNSVKGLAYFRNCSGLVAGADIFGFHNTTVAAYAAAMNWLVESCEGYVTGRPLSTSNNLVTSHDKNMIGLTVGGTFNGAQGGACVFVGAGDGSVAGKYQVFGTSFGYDYGDRALGGTGQWGRSASFEDGTETWTDAVSCAFETKALAANTKLHQRRVPVSTRAAYAGAGATVDTW